ncbi:hypothetical protein [Armatimonas rosea]|uniref:Uncharacterized protein n=1 Tax=Armatimonas rosea TaxID=685828 RepID=A0A7W9SRP9_ARMRO|nr:hypothetical protein [Armatimonas rosea]MBB6051605.1 hypothetical protein [Armatimonas rosea]
MPQKPIQTLADALAFLHWDPRRHGALLCIAPEKTPLLLPSPSREILGALGAYEAWLKQQTLLAQQKLGMPPPGGWMPQELVAAFGRGLRRFGSVTALGPAERVGYSRNPAPPRFDASASTFLETVTEAQWQQLCGGGLAVAQCTAAQRALVLGLLPESTLIRDASFQGMIPLDGPRRSQLMLSLGLVAIVQGPPIGPFGFTLLGSGFNFPLKPQVPPLGQELLQRLPNRGGVGQLNPRALSGQVALEGEKVTVALLLERATQASGVLVRADARVAKLPVWSQGTTLATGELLEALCFALAGVFRKTDEGFLLVEELAPLQVRRARVAEWHASAEAVHPRETQAFAERFDALLSVPFATGAVFALTDSQRRQYRAAHQEGKELRLGYSELTASQQVVVDAEHKKLQTAFQAAQRQPAVAVTLDKVTVSLSLQLQARVPDAPTFYVGDIDLSETRRLRVSVKGRPVLVRVGDKDKDELKALLQAAQEAGAAAVWLEASPELLEVALAERRLPIWACVPVLRSNDGTPARNSLGETWRALCRRRFRRDELDWLDPGVESNLAVARATIERFRLPQVAGLVLTETVPPGFREEVSDCHTEELGYTPERCRAFRQKNGVEPADVIVSYGRTFPSESDRRLFPPAHDLAQTWLGEREDDADRFLTRLQQALLKEQPTLSVWWGGSSTWVVCWKAKQPIPLLYPYYDPTPAKEYETQWVVAPEKFTEKTPSTATVDLRTLSVSALLAGFRQGVF